VKPHGRVREKVGLGGILTIVFILSIMLFVLLVSERPPAPEEEIILAEEEVILSQNETHLTHEQITETAVIRSLPPVLIDAPENYIYSLAHDAFVQSLEVGDYGMWIVGDRGYLTRSGGPEFYIAENPLGGNAIRVTDRSERYDTLDVSIFSANVLSLSENTYAIFVSGIATPGIPVSIRAMDSPWRRVVEDTVADDGNFSLEYQFSTEILTEVEGGIEQFTQRGFRIQVDNLEDFIVTEITVVKL
jgi:hypothetical protein